MSASVLKTEFYVLFQQSRQAVYFEFTNTLRKFKMCNSICIIFVNNVLFIYQIFHKSLVNSMNFKNFIKIHQIS